MAQRVRMKDGGSLVAIIADEDTIAGFLLAGVGSAERGKNQNFLAVTTKTAKNQIEDAFKKFTSRDDIGVLLISQDIAEVIRHLLDDYEQLLPTVLEIPSKDHPYDPTKDGIMQRIKRMLGQD
jgi:V-type H+-transporting ATPase subunit F